jgi:hypothetical protein
MRRDLAALHAYLAAGADVPFAWGSNDCVTFAAGAVAAQTGLNPLAKLSRRWSTQRGALLLLRRYGGLEAAVSTVLTPVAPALAHRGDIAGVRAEAGEMVLMVIEGALLVGPDANGVRRLPRELMTVAWSAICP